MDQQSCNPIFQVRMLPNLMSTKWSTMRNSATFDVQFFSFWLNFLLIIAFPGGILDSSENASSYSKQNLRVHAFLLLSLTLQAQGHYCQTVLKNQLLSLFQLSNILISTANLGALLRAAKVPTAFFNAETDFNNSFVSDRKTEAFSPSPHLLFLPHFNAVNVHLFALRNSRPERLRMV